MPTGFTTFIATNIQDVTGEPLAEGFLLVQPTDGKNVPITARSGGAGGQMTVMPAIWPITSGSIGSGKQIADTALTSPAKIYYRITVQDPQGRTLAVYKGVQPTGSSFNFDTYDTAVPTQAPYTPVPGPPVNFRGAYNSLTTYAVGDTVSLGGSSYISLVVSNVGNNPTLYPAKWAVLAAAGDASALQAPLVSAGIVSVTGGSSVVLGSNGTFATPNNAIGCCVIPEVATSSGPINSITMKFNGPTTGQDVQFIVCDIATPGTFSVASRVTLHPVTASGFSTQTFVSGTDFSPMSITAGQTIGFICGSAPVPYSNSAGHTFWFNGPDPGGTPTAFTSFGGYVDLSVSIAGTTTLTLNPNFAPVQYRGAYSSVTVYATGDTVAAGGSTYVSLVPSNTGNTPSSSPSQWAALGSGGSSSLQTALADCGIIELTGVYTLGSNGTFATPDNAIGCIILPELVTAGGDLSSITMKFSSPTAGQTAHFIVWDVETPGPNGTYSVAHQITLSPSAASGDSTQTFVSGRDFSPLTVAAGQAIGFEHLTAGVPYANASDAPSGPGFDFAGPNPGGTPAAFTHYGGYIDLSVVITPSGAVLSPNLDFLTIGLYGVPWKGKKWVNFGDSYSWNFSNIWQNAVAAALGLTPLVDGVTQYANGGRSMSLSHDPSNWIFSDFMTGSGGTFNAAALAAALSGADLVTIALGTNDANRVAGGYPLGTPADAINAGTACGDLNNALTQICLACPTAKIVGIGPLHVQRISGQTLPSGDFDNWYSDATAEAMIAAYKTIYGNFGVGFIDVGHGAGFNRFNIANPDGSALLFRDHLHPSTLGFTNYYAPYIARNLVNYAFT